MAANIAPCAIRYSAGVGCGQHEQIYKINVKQNFTIMNKSEEQSIRQSMRERGEYALPGLHEFSVKQVEVKCPICVEGSLHQERTINSLSNGVQVPCLYHACDSCGSEIGLSSDTRINADIARRARQAVTRKEFLDPLSVVPDLSLRKDTLEFMARVLLGGGSVDHTSDCALHNMPAYPAGECDCLARPAHEYFVVENIANS